VFRRGVVTTSHLSIRKSRQTSSSRETPSSPVNKTIKASPLIKSGYGRSFAMRAPGDGDEEKKRRVINVCATLRVSAKRVEATVLGNLEPIMYTNYFAKPLCISTRSTRRGILRCCAQVPYDASVKDAALSGVVIIHGGSPVGELTKARYQRDTANCSFSFVCVKVLRKTTHGRFRIIGACETSVPTQIQRLPIDTSHTRKTYCTRHRAMMNPISRTLILPALFQAASRRRFLNIA
jgi:hypothetical protein